MKFEQQLGIKKPISQTSQESISEEYDKELEEYNRQLAEYEAQRKSIEDYNNALESVRKAYQKGKLWAVAGFGDPLQKKIAKEWIKQGVPSSDTKEIFLYKQNLEARQNYIKQLEEQKKQIEDFKKNYPTEKLILDKSGKVIGVESGKLKQSVKIEDYDKLINKPITSLKVIEPTKIELQVSQAKIIDLNYARQREIDEAYKDYQKRNISKQQYESEVKAIKDYYKYGTTTQLTKVPRKTGVMTFEGEPSYRTTEDKRNEVVRQRIWLEQAKVKEEPKNFFEKGLTPQGKKVIEEVKKLDIKNLYEGGKDLYYFGKENLGKGFDWTKEKISNLEVPLFTITGGTSGLKVKEIVTETKEKIIPKIKETKIGSYIDKQLEQGVKIPIFVLGRGSIDTSFKDVGKEVKEQSQKKFEKEFGTIESISKVETEKTLEPKFEYVSEELSKIYGEKISKGEITEEQAIKEFEQSEFYKKSSEEYSKAYEEEHRKQQLKQEKEFYSDKNFIDKALSIGKYGALYGTEKLGEFSEDLTYKKLIKGSVVVGAGYEAMTLLPKLTMAYIYGYRVPKTAYEILSPKYTISEKLVAGAELGAIAGVTGYVGYKKWKQPSLTTEEILISPKLKTGEKIPKISKVLRTEELTDVYGNTLSKNIQKASYIDEELLAGKRTIVSQRNILHPFKKVPIYEGVPYEDLEGYYKATKSLKSTGLSESEIKKILRYTAPKRIEYKLKSSDLTKDFADIEVYTSNLLEKPVVKIKGAVTEKLDVYDVDKLLGIKTRGGLGRVKYVDVTGELYGTKGDLELIKLYTKESEAILKGDIAFTKLSKAGKLTKDYETISGIKKIAEEERLIGRKGIKLYHGTTEQNVKDIMNKGFEGWVTKDIERAKGYAGRKFVQEGGKSPIKILEINAKQSDIISKDLAEGFKIKKVSPKYISEPLDFEVFKKTPIELYAEKSITRQVIPKKRMLTEETGLVFVESETGKPLKISVDLGEIYGIKAKEQIIKKIKQIRPKADIEADIIKNSDEIIKSLRSIYGTPQELETKNIIKDISVSAISKIKVKPKIERVSEIKNIIKESNILDNQLTKLATKDILKETHLGETKFLDLTGKSQYKSQTESRFGDLGVSETRFGSLKNLDISSQVTKLKQEPRTKLKEQNLENLKNLEEELLKEKVLTKLKTGLQERQKLKEALKTKQSEKQLLKSILKTNITTRARINRQPPYKPPKVPIIPFTFDIDSKELMKDILRNDYKVYTKKAGKEINIGKFENLDIAGDFLKDVLKTELRASGYITKKGKRVSLKGLIMSDKDFRAGITKGEKDIFRIVQKRGKRLSSPEEVKSIQIAKLTRGMIA